MQSSQPFHHQLQMLTPQQQQLLLQAQHNNLTSPSASDMESRRLRLLLNRNIGIGKDGQSNSVGEVVPNVGSPMQAACPVLPRGADAELLKVPIPLANHSICNCSSFMYGFLLLVIFPSNSHWLPCITCLCVLENIATATTAEQQSTTSAACTFESAISKFEPPSTPARQNGGCWQRHSGW